MENKINKSILIRMSIRVHFVMSAWNFQRMLNLGFLYGVAPALQKLYPTGKKRVEAMQRHVQFFNTHPYFASFIMGLVVKKEEQMMAENESSPPSEIQPKTIESVKTMFMGPLGALGDLFFWGNLRPFLGLLAVLIGLLTISTKSLFWLGPLVFFILYNLFHEYVRVGGIFIGYQKGEESVKFIQELDLQKVILYIQNFGILLVGVLLGLAAFSNPVNLNMENQKPILGVFDSFIIIAGLSYLFYLGLQKKITSARLFFIGLLIFWIIDLVIRGV